MSIDFTREFEDIETGEPLLDEKFDQETGKVLNQGSAPPFTLRLAAIRSLLSATRNEGEVNGEEKLRRYELAIRIKNEDKIDLPTEDVSLLKERIAKMWPGSLIPGQAWKMLDPLVGSGPGGKEKK